MNALVLVLNYALRALQRYLSEDAAAAVQELLPEAAGGELSTMCTWADNVRFRYYWASPLHYANTPGVCNFKSTRRCFLLLPSRPLQFLLDRRY
jgi:hypothetical protein